MYVVGVDQRIPRRRHIGSQDSSRAGRPLAGGATRGCRVARGRRAAVNSDVGLADGDDSTITLEPGDNQEGRLAPVLRCVGVAADAEQAAGVLYGEDCGLAFWARGGYWLI